MKNYYLLTLDKKGLTMFTEVENFKILIPVEQRKGLEIGENVLMLNTTQFGKIKRETIRLKGLKIQSCDPHGRLMKNIHLYPSVIERLTIAAVKEGSDFKNFVENLLTDKAENHG